MNSIWRRIASEGHRTKVIWHEAIPDLVDNRGLPRQNCRMDFGSAEEEGALFSSELNLFDPLYEHGRRSLQWNSSIHPLLLLPLPGRLIDQREESFSGNTDLFRHRFHPLSDELLSSNEEALGCEEKEMPLPCATNPLLSRKRPTGSSLM